MSSLTRRGGSKLPRPAVGVKKPVTLARCTKCKTRERMPRRTLCAECVRVAPGAVAGDAPRPCPIDAGGCGRTLPAVAFPVALATHGRRGRQTSRVTVGTLCEFCTEARRGGRANGNASQQGDVTPYWQAWQEVEQLSGRPAIEWINRKGPWNDLMYARMASLAGIRLTPLAARTLRLHGWLDVVPVDAPDPEPFDLTTLADLEELLDADDDDLAA